MQLLLYQCVPLFRKSERTVFFNKRLIPLVVLLEIRFDSIGLYCLSNASYVLIGEFASLFITLSQLFQRCFRNIIRTKYPKVVLSRS